MPTENINFQEIWTRKNTEIPNIRAIQSAAEDYKKKQLRTTVWQLFSLVITALMIIYIWTSIDFKMLSTTIGIVLLLCALALYICLYSLNINIIRKINPSISNQEYLTALKKLQQQRLYMQTQGISIYYILLSVGFALYFYEFAVKLSPIAGILTYVLTFFWLLIVWFFIRPRQVRRQNAKIAKVIASLESIERDMKENI